MEKKKVTPKELVSYLFNRVSDRNNFLYDIYYLKISDENVFEYFRIFFFLQGGGRYYIEGLWNYIDLALIWLCYQIVVYFLSNYYIIWTLVFYKLCIRMTRSWGTHDSLLDQWELHCTCSLLYLLRLVFHLVNSSHTKLIFGK